MYPESSFNVVMIRFMHRGLYYTRKLSKIVPGLNTLASLITGGLFHSLATCTGFSLSLHVVHFPV